MSLGSATADRPLSLELKMGRGGLGEVPALYPDAGTVAPDASLQEADCVELTGLVAAPQHNGRIGQLLLYRGERWVVLLQPRDGDPPDPHYLSLRAHSLAKIRGTDINIMLNTSAEQEEFEVAAYSVYTMLDRHSVEKLRFLCSPGECDWKQAVAMRDAALAQAKAAWSRWTFGASEIYKFLSQAFQNLGDRPQALDMLLHNASMFAQANNQRWLGDAWCRCGEPRPGELHMIRPELTHSWLCCASQDSYL